MILHEDDASLHTKVYALGDKNKHSLNQRI